MGGAVHHFGIGSAVSWRRGDEAISSWPIAKLLLLLLLLLMVVRKMLFQILRGYISCKVGGLGRMVHPTQHFVSNDIASSKLVSSATEKKLFIVRGHSNKQVQSLKRNLLSSVERVSKIGI